MTESIAKVAFQGAPGAFSHQAAKNFNDILKLKSDHLPCQSFAEVFQNVSQGLASYGAIPLENSSIGSIAANYDLLWNNDLVIVSELFLPVHHALISHVGVQLKEITAVYSHPAALDQCRGLFQEHPQMVARVYWDTSGAVAFVKDSQDRCAAAIASEAAAAEYGMHIIQSNIEDYPDNATRFALITQKNVVNQAIQLDQSRPFKISYAVELGHKPGTLAALLGGLAQTGANLTKIESRPIGESPWHYRFFLDMDVADSGMESKVYAIMQTASSTHKLLGKYILAAVSSKTAC